MSQAYFKSIYLPIKLTLAAYLVRLHSLIIKGWDFSNSRSLCFKLYVINTSGLAMAAT